MAFNGCNWSCLHFLHHSSKSFFSYLVLFVKNNFGKKSFETSTSSKTFDSNNNL